jgi:hypothetical protein
MLSAVYLGSAGAQNTPHAATATIINSNYSASGPGPRKSILILMDHCSPLTPMIEFIGQTDSPRNAGPQLDSLDRKEI